MLDYRGIEALHMVVEEQSFEVAASKLYITQSAVSQRIKGLETHFGEPILIRVLPYKPTKLGEYLIGHFKRISLLEDSLKQQITHSTGKPQISIALNRDSLETWFLELMGNKAIFNAITLQIIADDQEFTLDYLRKGIVSACLSTAEKPIIGGKATLLGDMEYVLVASPVFVKKYFASKDQKKSLINAPALKFDKQDMLHERYLEKFFGISGESLEFQIIPSVQGFKRYAVLGYGYGLIPRIDVIKELKSKKLLQLHKDKVWKIPLYWHYWDIDSTFYKKFNAELIQHVKALLK